jgi:predicted transcriptional regulator
MNADYKESLIKAKKIADKVSVRLETKPMPKLYETEKKEKQLKEEEPKPKNQLVLVPNKVDLAYQGKIREEDLEVDDPVHVLVQRFRDGEILAEDMSVDDKFVIIRHMREIDGMTQDEIAEEMGVSRRTVGNYCAKIKKLNAQKLADADIWEIGGELYHTGMKAMRDAIQTGKYKEFAYLMTSLIATLQSMGLVFKLPKQSQIQQSITQEIAAKKGAEGFKQLKHMGESQEINLDNVLNELLGAVKSGKLDVDKKD